MASIGHVAVGMACGRAFSREPALARRAMIAFSAISLWPDLDSIGFLVGIDYGHSLGHRGATHFAARRALRGDGGLRVCRAERPRSEADGMVFDDRAASHALLDTMTYGGGLGCALLWPFSDERFWAPVRFIPIAPIGLRLLTPRGFLVMGTELVMFAPLFVYALLPRKR